MWRTSGLQFTKSGRYWGVSGSSANITCKAESDSCFNLPDSPVAMGWAEAPLGLGYKCTKPPVASIMAKLNSGKSVSIQFSSVQVSNVRMIIQLICNPEKRNDSLGFVGVKDSLFLWL
ncbi:unnamed protein product [Trichobilharzia regenti]|nr:unnamed protein product [Trichobilharzia regenti]